MLKMLLLSVLLGALVQKSSAQECQCSPLVNLINTINVPAKDIKILSTTIPKIPGIALIGGLSLKGEFQLTANPDDLVIENGQITVQLAGNGQINFNFGTTEIKGDIDLELKATLADDCKLSGIDIKPSGSCSVTITTLGVTLDIIKVGETNLPLEVAKELAANVGKVIDRLLQNQDVCEAVDS